jgi:plasmid stabilization system protein ParE
LTSDTAFTVEISPRAEHDIEEIFEYIAADAPLNAKRWREGLEERINSLASMATGFGFAPENRDARIEVRQLIYGHYRILYTVRKEENVAYLLTVRHGARTFLRGSELDDISEA